MPRDESWVPRKYLDRLNADASFTPEVVDDKTKYAKQIMSDALPYVAMTLVELALKNPDDRIRLSASNALMDRVLGKSGILTDAQLSPSEKLLTNLQEEVDNIIAKALSDSN